MLWIKKNLKGDAYVALREEGVDRNASPLVTLSSISWSPSARRAWIEIVRAVSEAPVERSPSARRAWIEITGV